MAKRMLVDATHAEETRVVVVNGNRLEELDFEIASKKQLKGNIYLARVTRVEPSLQAAFVEYGGNRHGFLAFSEIHPDYYRIPVADREALVAEEAAMAESADVIGSNIDGNGTGAGGEAAVSSTATAPSEGGEGGDGENVEELGGDEAEEVSQRRPRPSRSYKIQEVIKRRQIMLVQVTKEERGNKGAALTTYLSLPGRYCVLMPNTGRGGGISRKITNPQDRKRLKEMMADLDIPEGMAVILRTAGMERSKTEIKRDLDYLLRLWDSIREQTLQSSAPALIYEEANLIKRSIRDLYSNDIDEVLVEGEDGYRTAKSFMRMLMPSHAKRVQPYRDDSIPLFFRYQVESQIDIIHSPISQLKSGGYIVINQTEALVAIDVNSGRATRERNIEETATKTNLEAADEVARQLRLRDLAGLIVIDFIDMEDQRNVAAVERRLKEAMKHDRARIQLGKISAFGLMELSRQRLRPSLMETNFERCAHCDGTGTIRSIESAALYVLRAIEEEGIRKRSSEITVSVPTRIALYILNQKRQNLAAIEARYGFRVFLHSDDSLIPPDFRLERIKARIAEDASAVITAEKIMADDDRKADDDAVSEVEDDTDHRDEEGDAPEGERHGAEGTAEGRDRRRRRGRRNRRRGGDEVQEQAAHNDTVENGEQEMAAEAMADGETGENGEQTGEDPDAPRRKRRRGKRGGRRRSRNRLEQSATFADAENGEETAPDQDGDIGMTDETAIEIATAAPETEGPVAETFADPADAPAEPVPTLVHATVEEAATEPKDPASDPEATPYGTDEAGATAMEIVEPAASASDMAAAEASPAVIQETDEAPASEEKPKKRTRRRKTTTGEDAPAKGKATKAKTVKEKTSGEKTTETKDADTADAEAEAKPKKAAAKRPRRRKADQAQPVADAATETGADAIRPEAAASPVNEAVATPVDEAVATPDMTVDVVRIEAPSPPVRTAGETRVDASPEQATHTARASEDHRNTANGNGADEVGEQAEREASVAEGVNTEGVNQPQGKPRRGWWNRLMN